MLRELFLRGVKHEGTTPHLGIRASKQAAGHLSRSSCGPPLPRGSFAGSESGFGVKVIGVVHLHGLPEQSAKPERVGTFFAVTGGRALSFPHLSMGETTGPERRRGEQQEGAELPP